MESPRNSVASPYYRPANSHQGTHWTVYQANAALGERPVGASRAGMRMGAHVTGRSQAGGENPAHSQETLPTAYAQGPLAIQGTPRVILILAPKQNFYSLLHRRAELCKYQGEKRKVNNSEVRDGSKRGNSPWPLVLSGFDVSTTPYNHQADLMGW